LQKYDWQGLLQQWNAELLSDSQIVAQLPAEVIESGWLGYPGATEEQIAVAEARLGATLPESFHEFLKLTNGWRMTGYFIDRIWSTEELQWFYVRNRQWADTYLQGGFEPVPDEKYFVYGKEQDGMLTMRVEYLKTALEISDVGDACIYLLNPRIRTPDGEWEAWFFSTWGGANRYRSFWELMLNEHEEYVALEKRNHPEG